MLYLQSTVRLEQAVPLVALTLHTTAPLVNNKFIGYSTLHTTVRHLLKYMKLVTLDYCTLNAILTVHDPSIAVYTKHCTQYTVHNTVHDYPTVNNPTVLFVVIYCTRHVTVQLPNICIHTYSSQFTTNYSNLLLQYTRYYNTLVTTIHQILQCPCSLGALSTTNLQTTLQQFVHIL